MRGPVIRSVVVAVVVSACSTGSSTHRSIPTTRLPPASGATLTIATYNVDFGADLAPLLKAPTDRLPALARAAFDDMRRSDYPGRAAAVARILARERPDLVGLQEVATWEQRARADPASRFRTVEDYQALLLGELARRGVAYEPVVSNTTFQGELPVCAQSPPGACDPSLVVRFTDHNVILRRRSATTVATAHPHDGRFVARIPVPQLHLFVTRGWASADVTVSGSTVRLYDTHLEAYSSVVRDAQAVELAARRAASPYPAIVVGDLNSTPTGCAGSTGAYQVLAASGLVEAWRAVHPGDPCGGATAGQKTLDQPTSTIDHRIDDVFVARARLAVETTRVVGDRPTDRSSGGLWPSDHAASVAVVRVRRSG